MKTVLYHKNCSDGLMSAVLLSLYYQEIREDANFMAVNYSEPMPEVVGGDIVIVDFSYTPEVLEVASRTVKSIVMLDHHLSAAKQWGGYKRFTHRCVDGSGCAMHLTIKEERSGAGLTWDYIQEQLGEKDSDIFKGNRYIANRLLRIVLAVEDRDLWKFSIPGTAIIGEVLRAVPMTVAAWSNFIMGSSSEEFEAACVVAATELALKERQSQGLAKKAKVMTLEGIPFPIPVVNCSAEFTSRVGEILYQEHPAALMWASDGATVFGSYRSNQVDVSVLAAQFGGGGHASAAGFRIGLVEFAQWLTK